jgi:hypothetical protein
MINEFMGVWPMLCPPHVHDFMVLKENVLLQPYFDAKPTMLLSFPYISPRKNDMVSCTPPTPVEPIPSTQTIDIPIHMSPTHIPLTLNTNKNPIHMEKFQDSLNDAMHEDNSLTMTLMH